MIDTYAVVVCILDPPHTTVYNVTTSSSLTPADLTGFDIRISWTVSNNSIMGCYGYTYIVRMIILYLEMC